MDVDKMPYLLHTGIVYESLASALSSEHPKAACCLVLPRAGYRLRLATASIGLLISKSIAYASS